MGYSFQDPPDFETFKAALAKRLPLRPAHASRLPGILLHHTRLPCTEVAGNEYYLKAWSAGIWLAGYIRRHAREFTGKRVLDVGTGSGLVAIAAAKAGAKVTAIDTNVEAIYAARMNAAANNAAITLLKADCAEFNDFGAFDVLTTTDTMYSTPVKNKIAEIVRQNAITVYICDQSGWADEEKLEEFQASIPQKGVRFEYLKKAPRFFGTSDSINNNPVTAIKITRSG